MPNESTIQESIDVFIAAWAHYARCLPGHHVESGDGAEIILTGTAMSVLNVAVLSSPVSGPEDLERRARNARTVVERVSGQGVPWFFVVPETFAPGADPEAANTVLTRIGLPRAMTIMGMVTSELTPPRHEASNLELRRVTDAETRDALSDLNCDCYGIPRPVGRASIGLEALWKDGNHGRVGYVDGEPASCALAIMVEDTAYVGFVATAAAHRRKGYAETVMRACLDDALKATGIRKTILHATEMGQPVYEAMGYRPITRFSFHAPAGEGA